MRGGQSLSSAASCDRDALYFGMLNIECWTLDGYGNTAKSQPDDQPRLIHTEIILLRSETDFETFVERFLLTGGQLAVTLTAEAVFPF